MKRLHIVVAAGLGLLATAPVQAGGIIVGMQLEPPHLDPTAGAAAAIREVTYANVLEGLTRFAEDGSIVPSLAESWEIAPDGLSWVFNLRQGATFHDGSELTADDVAYSFERAMAEDSTNAQPQLFDGINSVNVIDDYTLELGLDEPNANLLYNLAWGDAIILPEGSADTTRTNPVGTGPFRFENWVQGDRIDLLRYDEYWGEKPALDSITFKFISDPTAAFAAMMAGDVDAFPNFPAPENLAQFEADPRFQVLVGTTEGETILALNHAREPFGEPDVRQAIALAVDRKSIIDGAMFGYGTPIGSHFAPHSPDYIDLTDRSAYDPGKSRELLTRAGYEDGFTVTLALPPPSYARRGGEIVASQLREVGIDVEIVAMEWAQWLEQVFGRHDYDMTIVSHVEPLDIGIYGRDDYYFNFNDPVMRALMQGLARAADAAERHALLVAAQERVADQYVNVYLFQLAKAGVADARLQGLWLNSPVPAIDLTGVTWSK